MSSRVADLVAFRNHVREVHPCCRSAPLWALAQALEASPDDWAMANERLCGIMRRSASDADG